MSQSSRKELYIHPNAKKEFLAFPKATQNKFDTLFLELQKFGKLNYPNSRKLIGYNLLEMRVKSDGIYRCIYHSVKNTIVILVAFRKKTQKTPIKEIQKARKRKF